MRGGFLPPQSIQEKQNSFYPVGGNQQQVTFRDTVATDFVAWKLKTSSAQTLTADGEYGLVMGTTVHKYPSGLDVDTNPVVVTPVAGLYACVFHLRCQISTGNFDIAKIKLRLHVDVGGDDEVVAESVTVFGDSSAGDGTSFEILNDYAGAIEWLSGVSHYVVAAGDAITPTIEIIGLPGSETVSYEGFLCGYLLDNRAV